MIGKTMAGLAAALTFAITATAAGAAGPVGGAVGGAGAGGIGGIHGMSAMGFGAMNMSAIGAMGTSGNGKGGGSLNAVGPRMSGLQFPFPTNEPEHYHEIKLIGRVAKDESGLTVDQQLVRMRVDGRTIPMSINGDSMSNSLQLDQGDELGQNLYRLILSKQLVVVGDQKLRTQLADAAAANPANSKPIVVDGFVYDRMTPYLVLVSVGDAP